MLDITDDQRYTTAEVATLIQVDPQTVTRWVRAGSLPSIRTPGGHYRYLGSDLRELMDAGRE